MNLVSDESPYRLRVAGGNPVPVEVRVNRGEPIEMPGRYVNHLPGMTQIELRAMRPIPEFQPPFRFGQDVQPQRALLAVLHDRVDGLSEIGQVVGGRVLPIDWSNRSGLLLLWIPDDETEAIPE